MNDKSLSLIAPFVCTDLIAVFPKPLNMLRHHVEIRLSEARHDRHIVLASDVAWLSICMLELPLMDFNS